MRKTLSVAALAIALTGSAFAADLPHYKAPLPPPPPPPPLWTGFYVGLNAGGTWANSSNVTNRAFPVLADTDIGAPNGTWALAMALGATNVVGGSRNSGFIGGGQIGYNWQFYNGAALAGIEADIQGIAANGGNSTTVATAIVPALNGAANPVVTFQSSRRSLDYIGTVRGRLGWLFTPTLLLYGTGGLAYGGVTASTSIAQTIAGPGVGAGAFVAPFSASSFSDTRVGWTAGAGIEWMFWPHWSAKVEYLYYDLGNVTFSPGITALNPLFAPGTGFSTAAIASQSSTRFNGNIVRAGVNYHFNWGAPPVVAKY